MTGALLLPAEWLTLGFAAWLMLVAAARRERARSAGAAAALAAALAALVLLTAWFVPAVRGWMPLAYIAAGYWTPVPLLPADAGRVAGRFATWLAATDRGVESRVTGLPGWIRHAADICYLLCYPMVPAGYGVLLSVGTDADERRFWLAVLGAAFPCYATLPWLVSLPPRRLAAAAAVRGRVADVNVAVLGRVSHEFNTFPSGHAAVSTAVAIALAPVPAAAAVAAAVAGGVCAGAVIGGHHYAIDVVLGVLLGAAAGAGALALI